MASGNILKTKTISFLNISGGGDECVEKQRVFCGL
jgi:hypothetical protein